tara:strand:- start:1870 stop:2910 length:1041 start_codon:yes stop_codon:yes gene_type:complete
MSDIELISSEAVDVETGKEVDLKELADPMKEGDVPDPSPIKSKTKTPTKIDEEVKWNNYLDVYNQLQKLRLKQDKKIESIKKNYNKKNPDASIQDKKLNLEKKKKQMKCPNCGKSGALIFTETSAICGAAEPCNLSIKLEKPTIVDIPKQLNYLRRQISLQKRIITEYKLDLLFDLDDEEVILNEFQTNKENLEKLLDYAGEMKEFYDKKNKMVEIYNLEQDNESKETNESKEKQFISRKEELDNTQKEFNQLVSDFKKNIKQYQETGEKDLLNDTIQIYKNIIIPIQLKIRNLKYQVTYVDKISQSNNGKINKKEMPIFHFMPTKINIENESFINDDFEIEENKK